MRLRYHTVLFDFDGTLCASGEGIISCVKLALQEMGAPALPESTLRRFIGPPAEDCYRNFCGMTPEQAKEAVRHFRIHYDDQDGWKQSTVYPGIPELLRDLQKDGATICTASSKPHVMVVRMLQYFGIFSYFHEICAAADNGTGAEKATIIRRAMALCHTQDLSDTVMIGDTHFDAQGAAAVGLPFIGAAYGYGGRADLEAGGATVFADSPEDLRRYLWEP